MYRLVASDVDGTLLNSHGEITPLVRDAIDRVVEQGVRFVVVSGRNRAGVRRIMDQLGLDTWFISSGGAVVGDVGKSSILACYVIPQPTVETIIQTARKAGAGIFLELPEMLYWEGPDLYLSWIRSLEGITLVKKDEIIQVMDSDPLKVTVIQEHEGLLKIEQSLRAMNLPINLTYSLPYSLEITSLGADKGNALSLLAAHLDIPLEETAAVGDGENDIPMLEAAGLGIAMGNAPLIVKQAAQLVAPSNDEGGMAWALDRLNSNIL